MISKKGWKRLQPILRIGVSFLLIYYLLKKANLPIIYETLKKVRVEFLGLAVLLHLAGDFLSSLQWQIVLSINQVKLSLKKLFPLYLIGAFFSSFLPTNIGGDVYKIHRLTAYKVKISQAFTSVLMARIMGLWALIFVATLTFFWPPNLAISGLKTKLLLALLWGGIILIFYLPRFLHKLNFLSEIHSALASYGREKKIFIISLLVSLIAQVLGIFYCAAIAFSLKLNLSLMQIAYFSSLTIIISALPVAINGLGIREWSYVLLFHKVGLSREAALSFSLLIIVFIILRSTLGGLCYALGRDKF